MLILRNQKELDTILNYIKPHIQNIPEFRNLLFKNVKIVPDPDLDKQIDSLQNELAELEEVKDDLTIKLSFLRRDLCEELKNEYDKTDFGECKNNFDFNNEEMVYEKIVFEKMEKISLDGIFNDIKRLNKILDSESEKKNVKKLNEFDNAIQYFNNL
ncbi:hypothetical protein GVAV_000846 [Gurleya vavrai]